jgi:hypothetical protein
VVCAGGCTDKEYNSLSDMWVVTGLTVSPAGVASFMWVDMSARVSGIPPAGRWGHGAVMVRAVSPASGTVEWSFRLPCLQVRNVMCVFGGRRGLQDLNDIAVFTFDCELPGCLCRLGSRAFTLPWFGSTGRSCWTLVLSRVFQSNVLSDSSPTELVVLCWVNPCGVRWLLGRVPQRHLHADVALRNADVPSPWSINARRITCLGHSR